MSEIIVEYIEILNTRTYSYNVWLKLANLTSNRTKLIISKRGKWLNIKKFLNSSLELNFNLKIVDVVLKLIVEF